VLVSSSLHTDSVELGSGPGVLDSSSQKDSVELETIGALVMEEPGAEEMETEGIETGTELETSSSSSQ
jgi:hypothetical protein